MRKSKWMKPVAAALTLAMALSGTAVVGGTDNAVAAESGTISVADTGSLIKPASGSAADLNKLTGDAGALKTDLDPVSVLTQNLLEGHTVLIQHEEIVDIDEQAAYYADFALSGPETKYYVHQFGKKQSIFPIFFTLEKKVLKFYNYDEKMVNIFGDFKAKPLLTLKNVTGVMLKDAKKALYTVKIKKGKTTTYKTFKLDFESVKKNGPVYTQKGKTVKQGKKKISKKKFDKIMKNVKEVDWSEGTGFSKLYTTSEFLYMTKDQFVLRRELLTKEGEKQNPRQFLTHVLRYDKEDTVNPYKAFGAMPDNTKYRGVFGADEKADWERVRDLTMDPITFIQPLRDALDPTKTTVSKSPRSTGRDTIYCITPKLDDDDAVEGDAYWEVHVDESEDIPRLTSVEWMTSIGVVEEQYVFYNDKDAVVDGEIYEPGSDAECYASEDYVKATGAKLRTLKVNYAGTEKEVKTTEGVEFRFFSPNGKFTGKVNGTEMQLSGKEAYEKREEINKALNPETGKTDSGSRLFGESTITDLKWTPNLK